MSETEERALAHALRSLVSDPLAPVHLADRVERRLPAPPFLRKSEEVVV